MKSLRLCLSLAAALIAAPAGAREPVVPAARDLVQPLVAKHVAPGWKATAAKLAIGEKYPALLKTPCRLAAAKDPWAGLADLEQAGLRAADLARGGMKNLPALLRALRASRAEAPVATATGLAPADTMEAVLRTLQQADALRDGALTKLPAANRTFLFNWPGAMVRTFGPQLPVQKETQAPLTNTRALCVFAETYYDWNKLLTAAEILASIASPETLAAIGKQFAHAAPLDKRVSGVSGNVLYARKTDAGMVIVGGPDKNIYELTDPVALLIDLGGDDTYRGRLAASASHEHPNALAIDLAGNDTYEASPFGLATGRAGGVGMLIDFAGDDIYKLAVASGGVGMGGIGVLVDCKGDDVYTGSKYTQGAAIGGLGLLLDLEGDDRHTSFGNALGFAGPGAAAAVIDVAGDDVYQCGRKYPSGYNASITPAPKPGDANFQYTAMGMGAGQGRRVLSGDRNHLQYNLAGGVGMMIDLAGGDTYDSSNFSQGCGYFFGAGLKLDLDGDDTHGAARYGHASGAHFGMGLFVDYAGTDRYTSTGPTYNGGCSWDHSAFLFVDAGEEGDAYEFERSAGPGRADIGAWGAAVDMGGNDRYVCPRGLGRATRDATAVFLDAGGTDTYEKTPTNATHKPANNQAQKQGDAGLFVDQQK